MSSGVQLHCTNSALYEETVNAKYRGVLSLFENHGSLVQLIFHREMAHLNGYFRKINTYAGINIATKCKTFLNFFTNVLGWTLEDMIIHFLQSGGDG